jgi:hypothetical protein
MNLRRYALFLLVAVLTFVIGVTAAVLVGKVNPFPHVQEARRSCSRLSALPDHRSRITVYTVYRSDGTLLKSYEVDKTYEGTDTLGVTTDELEPPPPPPPAMKVVPRSSR